jgi:dephospho-CoA kinase
MHSVPRSPSGTRPLSSGSIFSRVTNAVRRVPVIGLVGGIGSGKSHLARQLRENHPVEIVEGDSTGHRVLQEPAVKEGLRKAFGDAVFSATGEIDRSRIKGLVFGSAPEQQAARQKLEEIVHPRLTESLACQIALARARPGVEAVILDAALVLEAGWRNLCDAVVFIDAPLAERLSRVMRRRGWSREEWELREASQYPLERKRTEADYVVENHGDGPSALSRLEAVYSQVLASGHP